MTSTITDNIALIVSLVNSMACDAFTSQYVSNSHVEENNQNPPLAQK